MYTSMNVYTNMNNDMCASLTKNEHEHKNKDEHEHEQMYTINNILINIDIAGVVGRGSNA